MNTETNLMITAEKSSLYQAIKDHDLEKIKLMLNDGKININEPIITTGPYAGFTALHLAYMEDYEDLMKLLLTDYKADANVMAEDGIRPIHLACFSDVTDEYSILRYIQYLYFGKANFNAEFGREIFLKYVKDKEWCPDFGDKMSILTYHIVISKRDIVGRDSVIFGSNIKIKSLETNKTLLMYALENDCYRTALHIALTANLTNNPEYINHRDSDGIPAIHYLMHPKRYGDFRYASSERSCIYYVEKENAMKSIISASADINALINDDPLTFLPNMAAYRGCPEFLACVLPAYQSIAQSKALYYATLPVEDPDKYFRRNPDEPDDEFFLETARQKCIELILKDLINRLTFGLPVPKEEKQIMDKLIATNTNIRNLVHAYKRDFIERKLKNNVYEFSHKKMSYYDFLMQVFENKKKLKVLAKDPSLSEAWNDITFDYYGDNDYSDYCYFYRPVAQRVETVQKRSELFKKLKTISQLTEAISLPYELILDIIEYLNNEAFESLIKAFMYP